MKKITLNVDDLGLSDAVNQAVLCLAQMRRIHATSFMSAGAIRPSEVVQLQRLNVDIGLHLDLTGLVCQGSLKAVMARSWLRLWGRAQLRQLIVQQFDAFEATMNAAPAFVDGHQHVHQFPVVRTLLLEELSRRYACPIMPIRNTQAIQSDFKARLIHALGGRALNRMCAQCGIRQNSWFGGVYDFQADQARLAGYWREWLSRAPERGTVLMCHPAVPDAHWQDSIKAAREQEWLWLSSDAFGQLWHEFCCEAQSWSEISHA